MCDKARELCECIQVHHSRFALQFEITTQMQRRPMHPQHPHREICDLTGGLEVCLCDLGVPYDRIEWGGGGPESAG